MIKNLPHKKMITEDQGDSSEGGLNFSLSFTPKWKNNLLRFVSNIAHALFINFTLKT